MKKNQIIQKWEKVKSNNRLGFIGKIILPKEVDIKTLTVWKLHKKEILPIRPYHNHNVHILHIGHDLRIDTHNKTLNTSSDGLYDDLLLIEWGEEIPLICNSCNKEIPDSILSKFCIHCGAKVT